MQDQGQEEIWIKRKVLILISQIFLVKGARYCILSFLKEDWQTFTSWWYDHCPLVWLFHISKLNSQINKLHERALGIVYQHCTPSFTELLENYNSGAIHNKIIWLPATELAIATNEL